MPKSMAVIDAGEWGEMSRADGDYTDLVSLLKNDLERRDAEVAVATSVDEAQSWLNSRGGGTIIFTTRGMIGEARQLAVADGSRIRVVVLTGLLPRWIPDDGVIWVDKGAPLDVMYKAILGE